MSAHAPPPRAHAPTRTPLRLSARPLPSGPAACARVRSYPIIADPTREIATAFGMLDGTNPQEGMPLTCRAVFVFGPDKTLKLQLLYPASSGRNFGEVLRAIDSLQMTAVHKVATPANWMPGKPCMVRDRARAPCAACAGERARAPTRR